uniref:Chemokine interleukin-8-like domain-containing protein n=1 Tax=Anabas testudineus TaxID=64144 RepID=A0A7N6BMH7_ANATE
MSSNLVIVTLLSFITWMSLTHANNGRVSNCCLLLSNTKTYLENIVNYTIQSDSVCPIKAVVFHTIYGKNICSDPKNGWAKKAIAKVDAARQALQMKGNNEEGSTTDITPAVPTTSKKTKAPARKARSERKPRKKRLLRKNMRKRKCCC